MKHFKIVLNNRKENLDLVKGCMYWDSNVCGMNDNNNSCHSYESCNATGYPTGYDNSGCHAYSDTCDYRDAAGCNGGITGSDYCSNDQSTCPSVDSCSYDSNSHCSISDYCNADFGSCGRSDGCGVDSSNCAGHDICQERDSTANCLYGDSCVPNDSHDCAGYMYDYN